MRFTQKIGLVTGGSRGIGFATASRLAAEGATVLMHYGHDGEAASRAVAAIAEHGGVARPVQGAFDTTDGVEGVVASVARELQAAGRQLDFLVNNAAISPEAGIEDTSHELLEQVMAVNAFAPVALIRGLLPEMADGGRIINVSSALTWAVMPEAVAYAMSKGALEAMTRTLAKGLGGRGITVNTVSPGVIDTEMNAEWLGQHPENREWVIGDTALARVGQPADVADIIAFLLSDDGRWITGQCIDASGGWHL